MKVEIIGALLIRMLGVIILLLGILMIIGTAISYIEMKQMSPIHDTYFVVSNIIWGPINFLLGMLLLLFSKKLGHYLAKGLE